MKFGAMTPFDLLIPAKVKILIFKNPRWPLNGRISAMVRPILMKFGLMMSLPIYHKNFELLKI